MSAPVLLIPAPDSTIVPFGFDVIAALPRREAAVRFPVWEARRAARSLPLGGRVVVVVGRQVAQAILARGVWADVELYEWSRAWRTDAEGESRVMRYAVVPFD